MKGKTRVENQPKSKVQKSNVDLDTVTVPIQGFNANHTESK